MDYYEHTRTEIRPLLPIGAQRILEIGAGSGSTLKWLKTVYPNAETTAVEINGALENRLRENADIVIVGGIDQVGSKLKRYDLVLLLDVLEHTVNPETILRNVRDCLDAEGEIIVSVPNIAHLSVSAPLLFKRRFAYGDAGIMDRTHLRFFVEQTALQLLGDAGFVVTDGLLTGIDGPKSRFLNLVSLGLLQHHLTKQYIMRGRKTESPSRPKRVEWKIA